MHEPVMLKEVIEALEIKPNGTYIDGTVGLGGHSSEILKRLEKRGFLFAFDQDENSILIANKRLSTIANNFKIIHSNFSQMKEKLVNENIKEFDGILFDLGVSSPQIDEASRGFSFMKDGILDMRMNQNQKKTAYEVVNKYKEKELIDIFFTYGEEKFSRKIASKIVEVRKIKPIETTLDLVSLIESSVPKEYAIKHHPERKIFQAIRIEVNNELNVLKNVLPDAINLLARGGRLAVITFHSLEDRIVKQTFKKYSEIDPIVKGLPNIEEKFLPKIKLVNKKPIIPTKEEQEKNSRSKSAKLRIIERL